MTTHSRGVWTLPKPHSVSANAPNLAEAESVFAQNSGSQTRDSSRRTAIARLSLGIAGGWLLSQIALPAYAGTLINNSGVQFDQDTTIESNFVESHGAYQSTFGVINLDTKEKTPLITETRASDDPESIFKPSTRRSHVGIRADFKGTPGTAVSQTTAQFQFQANQRYVLYLESSYNGRPTGVVYSTDVLNPDREQQVQFAGGITDLCSGGITVGWDDTGSRLVRNRQQQDRDFDDFIVQMKSLNCGMGGGEPPSVAVAAPESPGVIPPVVGGGGRFNPLLLAPLGLLGLFRGGGGGGGGGGLTPIPPGVLPSPPPGVSPSPPPSCPSGNCKPIPEPLTMLGSGSAIAFATLMQRRRKRNRK